MTRELLLAAAVIAVVTACASTGTPTPPPSTTAAGSGSPTASPPPQSGPTGITSEDAARIAPLAPARLTAVADAGGVQLTWPATGEDIQYYQCLRRTAPAGRWQPVARAAADQHTCLDHGPGAGTYVYGVQAVNASGLASPITESRPVTIS